ncbi:tetratricopeptide repeat protein [Pseudanabaena sp. BC1403]|uniref:tetratricopeptide repeat protein n=1 Tax=Pseudanabaena sp. BC1403 TaxID=2043171 RepID=UPI000CD999AA|nr:tetratricopeptide repeat protein [Pseudanabaena sp. BC1403]
MNFSFSFFTPNLIIFCGWIFSVCLHEWAHSVVAYLGGDISVKQKGYLSFNPLVYIHPVTSILLPLIVLVIGGIPLTGGAVYIEQASIPSRLMRSAVSLAGPSANIITALLFAIIYRYAPLTPIVLNALGFSIFLQFYAAILNLLPIPSLDGFGIIEPWLAPSQRTYIRSLGFNFGFIFLLSLLILVPNFSKSIVDASLKGTVALGVTLRAVGNGAEIFSGSNSKAIFGILILVMTVGFYFHHYIFTSHLRHFQNGYKFFAAGEFHKALKAYKDSVEQNPNFFEGWKQMGLVLYLLGQYEQSIAAIQKSIKLDRSDWSLYLFNGNSYAKLGKFAKSANDFSTALKLSPNKYVVYNDRGLALAEQGNYQQAISDLSTSIQLATDSPIILAFSYNNRGYAFYLQGDFESALIDINRSLSIDSSNYYAYYNRGLVYLAKELNSAAKEDLVRFVELCQTPQNKYSFQVQELLEKANLHIQKLA